LKIVPVINISNVVQYKPLSRNTKGTRRILDDISDMAYDLNVPQEKILYMFAKFLAETVKHRIKVSVDKQQVLGKPMKSVYKPLNNNYKKRKVPKNRNKFWVNTGFLVKNLKVYQARGTLYVGYPKYVKHKSSNVNMQMLISFLEKGTKKQPPRPLITPIVRSISKHIDELYDMFKRELVKNM